MRGFGVHPDFSLGALGLRRNRSRRSCRVCICLADRASVSSVARVLRSRTGICTVCRVRVAVSRWRCIYVANRTILRQHLWSNRRRCRRGLGLGARPQSRSWRLTRRSTRTPRLRHFVSADGSPVNLIVRPHVEISCPARPTALAVASRPHTAQCGQGPHAQATVACPVTPAWLVAIAPALEVVPMGASVKRRGRAIALGLTRRSSGRRPADRLRAGVGAAPLNFFR